MNNTQIDQLKGLRDRAQTKQTKWTSPYRAGRVGRLEYLLAQAEAASPGDAGDEAGEDNGFVLPIVDTNVTDANDVENAVTNVLCFKQPRKQKASAKRRRVTKAKKAGGARA